MPGWRRVRSAAVAAVHDPDTRLLVASHRRLAWFPDGGGCRRDRVVIARPARHHSPRPVSRAERGLALRGRRGGRFPVEIDRDFDAVIRARWARARPATTSRAPGSMIEIIESFVAYARPGSRIPSDVAGGAARRRPAGGVALGGAFFGESMFHRVTDASKVTLVALVDRARARASPARYPVGHAAPRAVRRRRDPAPHVS